MSRVAILPWGSRVISIGDGFGMMGEASETMFLIDWKKGDRASCIRPDWLSWPATPIQIQKAVIDAMGLEAPASDFVKLGVAYDTDGEPVNLLAVQSGIVNTPQIQRGHEWVHYYHTVLESPDPILHVITNRLIYVLGWRVSQASSAAKPGLMEYFQGPQYTPDDGRDPDLEDAIDKHGKWTHPKWDTA